MGVYSVPIQLRNWQNRFLPDDRNGQDVACDALLDSGAAELALPSDIIERRRLRQTGGGRVCAADGGVHAYRVFGIVDLEVQGRHCQVRARELPHGAEALLGAVPLAEIDWHISRRRKKHLPNPKLPEKPMLPLC